jgi:hypothetical protein
MYIKLPIYGNKRLRFELGSERFGQKASRLNSELNLRFGSANCLDFTPNLAFSSAGSVRTAVREPNWNTSTPPSRNLDLLISYHSYKKEAIYNDSTYIKLQNELLVIVFH